MTQHDTLLEDRLHKLNKLLKLGVNPYPSKFNKSHTIFDALSSLGTSVSCAGKIYSMRGHGNIMFADIQDESGKIQLFFKKDILDKQYDLVKLLDIGDFIGVEGLVEKTIAGEISIIPKNITLLSKSLKAIPHTWYGIKDVEIRYRKRYLDLLLNPEIKKVFLLRTKIIDLLREYLKKHNFFEVETPILQPLYGGATANPFITHHKSLDCNLYLRVADELYLKRLIIAGYEKVFEIGHDFRNEGLSRSHNPEFTQCEFYWAYVDYMYLMNFTQNMLSSIINKVNGSLKVTYQNKLYDFTLPWKSISFSDLLLQHIQLNSNEVDTEKKLDDFIQKQNLSIEKTSGYGQKLDKLYKKYIRPKLDGPLFLTDHPIELKPLAKKSEKDPKKAASFQLLVAGEEWINAYNELNDPQDQRKRWQGEENAGRMGADEHQVIDEDYIEALEYGMPPTAGWGMGIDRFVAFLANQYTIKDVILFPTLRPL